MAFPGILRRLFEKDGAGPLLRGDILPLERATYSVMLTASGTWTAPYAGFYFREVQGGGGGGGSCIKSGSAAIGAVAAGGGGSGGYDVSVKYYKKGDVVSYTIGAGGAKGDAASNGTGYRGGNTVFDGIIAAGAYSGRGDIDYVSSHSKAHYTTQAMLGAQMGGSGMVHTMATATGLPSTFIAGYGASSMFGMGGGAASVAVQAESAATNGGAAAGYGAGGGGGAGKNATAYGGNGSPGCVRLTFIGV